MGKLLFFFIIGTIGMTLRFFIMGELEWNQVFILLLFPIGALVVWFIHRWMVRRDVNYLPSNTDETWNTHMGERYSTSPKQLYKGKEKVAVYRRFYQHRWQHIVNEVVEGDGNWYMNLSFKLVAGEKVEFVEERSSLFKNNTDWIIMRDGVSVGKVKTEFSIKNAAKLKEALTVEIDDKVIYYQSFGIGSATDVLIDGHVVAKGKRSEVLRSKYHFELVDDGYAKHEEVLVMGFILFNYVHKQ
ncbi:hypothetical protein FZC76_14625 [Sutcliffiella horikoshii]|uniref:Tubby C-terminal domain-containing protein n=1 Tax=Sutcliffiella horikoshii TaxID=79883 RepID=A0A5D4SZY0_9BACI|nr:hypothetical protein [Sutcliffiella horikoshii]TYS67792.1 hypothetical protein FZC76_14625 [Sutcliffiella horikoshii]